MLSVVIPAYNEEKAIEQTITAVVEVLKKSSIEHEIIVVDDGSTDSTGSIIDDWERRGVIKAIHNPEPGGYGHSLKDGISRAKYDIIAISDADSTYPVEKIPELYSLVSNEGYDMAVGARMGSEYRGTFLKMPMRRVFLWLTEYASGQKIADINSGLRCFKKSLVNKFIHTISDGFSFTTTITLAFLLNGHFVKYIPIPYYKRVGKSHIRLWRDSLRSLQIIVENILYYNPLKLFLLISNVLISISAVSLLIYVLSENSQLVKYVGIMSVLSFVTAFIVFTVGLIADLMRINNKARYRD